MEPIHFRRNKEENVPDNDKDWVKTELIFSLDNIHPPSNRKKPLLLSGGGAINIAHRARTLHPRFAIDLHRESFARDDGDAATLGQPSAGMSESGLHLTHMQTVLQTNYLDQIVSNVCG
ncbi:hypothetical protein ALC53_03154 [Atta colombica]|uniref:Uncharacterized protein n=1 Tax=Atta colombica TaxID=520822 RepID=A0A195BRU0_9HYME|nr:hypothetical protein ALC53_03154 [Atta colombica]